ncbi:MAG: LysR family transcriptional regulator [Mycobacteriales bacterium]
MSDLTPPELRVLDAVAREGSFSAAAAALGLAQSAVSHAVRTIERKIGAVLFDRGRHGARPTPAGERAVVHARGVLRLLAVLHADTLAAAGSAPSGRLRVAAFRSAAAQLLPAALSRLAARHPGIGYDVAIVRDLGAGTAGEVVAGRADLALVNLPHRVSAEPGTRLVSGTLLTEPYVLIHPAGSPDPRRLPLLNWDENCSAGTQRWFAGQDWLPPATVEVADDSVLLSMVAHGMGMAVVPRTTAAGAGPEVTVRELGADAPTRTVGYVTTLELSRAAAVRALVRELRADHPAPPVEAA